MAGITLSDVVVPEFFNPYVAAKTLEKSAFFQSGIIAVSEEFDRLASQAAQVVSMPFFEDLLGDSEHIVEDADLEAAAIGCKKDVAPIIRRGKMWSATDLAAAMSGADPVAAVADLVAGFWSRDLQRELLAILNGVFAGQGMDGNLLDISANSGEAGKITPAGFIDAAQLLGDASENLGAVVMHSAVKAYLKKMDLIETVRPSESAEFETYQGVRVVVDDACPETGGVYRSYMFGQGAVAYGNGSPVGFVASEVDRDRKKGSGVDYIISRKTLILHPRGVKFTGDAVTLLEGPSREELTDGQNWERVYEPKQVRIVAFDYRIG